MKRSFLIIVVNVVRHYSEKRSNLCSFCQQLFIFQLLLLCENLFWIIFTVVKSQFYCSKVSVMFFFFILSSTEKKYINSSGILVADHKCFSSYASQNLSCKTKSTFSKASLMVLPSLFMLPIYLAVSKTSVILT